MKYDRYDYVNKIQGSLHRIKTRDVRAHREPFSLRGWLNGRCHKRDRSWLEKILRGYLNDRAWDRKVRERRRVRVDRERWVERQRALQAKYRRMSVEQLHAKDMMLPRDEDFTRSGELALGHQ